MKLKFIQPGYESYTGLLGAVEFVDGVSVDHVSVIEIRHISSCVAVVDAETGEDPSPAAEMVRARSVPMEVVKERERMVEGEGVIPVLQVADVLPTLPSYTREELSAIADKQGIKGLREIGEARGIKNVSINGLIDEIVLDQSKVAAVKVGD